jgi:hypothetical protein
MHYVAGAVAVAAGVVSSVGLHGLSSSGDKPLYLLVAAGLAAAWGAFVSLR